MSEPRVEASWPLGASGSPAAAWGVGWRGGTFSSSGPPLSSTAWGSKFPSVLVQGSVSFTLWLPVSFLVPSYIRRASLPYRSDLNWLCAGGCGHGAPGCRLLPLLPLLPLLWGWEWGRGGGRGLLLGEGGTRGEGLSCLAEPLCPPGSLQELPGYELRSAGISGGAGVHGRPRCPAPSPIPGVREIPGIPLRNPSSTGSGKGTSHYHDAVATNDLKKRVKSETQGRFRPPGTPGTTTAP